MFTLLGILLIVVGFGAAGMLVAEVAPEFMLTLPTQELGFVIVGFVGLLFLVIGRRPAD